MLCLSPPVAADPVMDPMLSLFPAPRAGWTADDPARAGTLVSRAYVSGSRRLSISIESNPQELAKLATLMRDPKAAVADRRQFIQISEFLGLKSDGGSVTILLFSPKYVVSVETRTGVEDCVAYARLIDRAKLAQLSQPEPAPK